MYYFIVNPSSRTGRGKKLWSTLEEELTNRGITYKAYFTERAGHATELAQEICALNDETKRIVIVGGDGTANEAINGLSNYSKIILGYIPTGSSNDLARGLKISANPLKALDTVLCPTNFKLIDHGILKYYNGSAPRTFAVSSGIGYDADICYEALTAPMKTFLNKIGLGKLIYFLIGIKQVIVNKPTEVTLTINGKQKLKYKKLIFIANMNLPLEGGGLPMAPDADPTDGRLSCCVVHDISKLRLLMLMPTIFKGKHVRHKGIDIINCDSIEIKTKRPLILHTDGEYAGTHKHVKLSCLPDKITMML